MDPITALAAATAIWNGLKSALAAGEDVKNVWGQLADWADKVGHVYDYLAEQESKPAIFRRLEFKQSETAEALSILAARRQLKEMESDLKHAFLYGDLCHMGLDGYNDFLALRQEIRFKRKKLLEQQKAKRLEFFTNLKLGGLAAALTAALIGFIWYAIILWRDIK